MKHYKVFIREFLASWAVALRKSRKLTQEEMAEQLRITSRAYGDLERGKFCFSAIALLFFMVMLSDEELLSFRNEFRVRMSAFEQGEAA